MTPSKPRKQYTPEFKAQAIELLALGRPVAELAEELCISVNLLYSCGAKSPSSARKTTF
ncbi:MAG: Transposase [Verrucomicrobiota bacterium]